MKNFFLFLLFVCASNSFAQVAVKNADSVQLGAPAGTGKIALFGKTILKNITEGTIADSILVRDSFGVVKFVKRATLGVSGGQGMTKTGDSLHLGGTYGPDVIIGGEVNKGKLYLGLGGASFLYDNLYDGSASLTIGNGLGDEPLTQVAITSNLGLQKRILLTGNSYEWHFAPGILITDQVNTMGLVYENKYRSHLSNRWIPDKEYVDSITTAKASSSVFQSLSQKDQPGGYVAYNGNKDIVTTGSVYGGGNYNTFGNTSFSGTLEVNSWNGIRWENGWRSNSYSATTWGLNNGLGTGGVEYKFSGNDIFDYDNIRFLKTGDVYSKAQVDSIASGGTSTGAYQAVSEKDQAGGYVAYDGGKNIVTTGSIYGSGNYNTFGNTSFSGTLEVNAANGIRWENGWRSNSFNATSWGINNGLGSGGVAYRFSNNDIFDNNDTRFLKTGDVYSKTHVDNMEATIVTKTGAQTIAGAKTFSDPVAASQYKLSDLNTAPASATATGTKGEIRVTADYIYVCVAANTWVRSPLTTW